MAAVEVTISGVLYDKTARTTQPVVLIGEASLTGLGVGGGPVYPPSGGGGEGIWGPTDPRPTPPIANVPGLPPTQNPPGWGAHPGFPIWGPPGSNFPDKPGYPPVAGHPLPEPPNKPPEPVEPPIEWKAVWHPQEGWVVVGIPQFPHPSPSA